MEQRFPAGSYRIHLFFLGLMMKAARFGDNAMNDWSTALLCRLSVRKETERKGPGSIRVALHGRSTALLCRLSVRKETERKGLSTMNAEQSSSRHPAQIASLVPGRLRLRLHRNSRDAQVMHRIKSGLESHEGIHDVRVNTLSGSVTVRYDHKRQGAAGILGWLEDLDVMVESIGHLPSVDGGESPGGPGFSAAIEDLNRRLYGLTGLPIDVKLVLPLAFVGGGIWSTVRKGLMIETVPGWLFLWFAFDMFVKLHPNHPDTIRPTRLNDVEMAGAREPRAAPGRAPAAARQPRLQGSALPRRSGSARRRPR